MDAALDALLPWGFPRAEILRVVKELLEVYGGNDGWPFIEEASYSLPINKLIEDGKENDADDGHQSKENSFDDQGVATTSAIVQNTQQQDRPESKAPADVEMPSVVASEPSPPEHIGSSSRIPEVNQMTSKKLA